jgi:hypothetical protein
MGVRKSNGKTASLNQQPITGLHVSMEMEILIASDGQVYSHPLTLCSRGPDSLRGNQHGASLHVELRAMYEYWIQFCIHIETLGLWTLSSDRISK